MTKTVTFMTRNFNKYDVMSIDEYIAIGGFTALKRAITMDGEDIAREIASCQV